MKSNLFFSIVLSIIWALTITSCSKEEEDEVYKDPPGTTYLDMLNEDNGKTLLANTNVYIDKDYNLYGNGYLMTCLGIRNGLGDITTTLLEGAHNKIIAETGGVYQIFNENDIIRFTSGKEAIDVDANYYNVCVVSQIMQNGKVVGAKVKYVNARVDDYGLAAKESAIGTLSYTGQEITLEFPTPDFETAYYHMGINSYTFTQSGNKLSVKLAEMVSEDTFNFFVRINKGFKRFSVNVKPN